MMYCDYNKLIDCSLGLNSEFNNILNSFKDIESSFSLVTNSGVWDSKTKDFIVDKFENIKSSFDIVNNQFNNVQQYLDLVISNYQKLDSHDFIGG